MIIIRYLIRPYLYLQYYYHKITKTGSFASGQVEFILEPYKNSGNTIKDNMFKHHVKQFHESSCSVASVVCIINSLMDAKGKLNGHPITQKAILERVKEAHWKERMGENGYNGRRGLPLTTLGRVIKSSLDTYNIPYKSVETVQAKKDPLQSKIIKQQLRLKLEEYDKKGSCLIISHFDQGCYVPELHIPHISPVGKYDTTTDKVTLLDVDPDQPNPYRISFDTFYEGLSSNYNNVFRMFGYAEGGYVCIQL